MWPNCWYRRQNPSTTTERQDHLNEDDAAIGPMEDAQPRIAQCVINKILSTSPSLIFRETSNDNPVPRNCFLPKFIYFDERMKTGVCLETPSAMGLSPPSPIPGQAHSN